MDDVRVWLGSVSVHNDRLDLSIELEEEIKCSIASNRCDSFTYILQGWFTNPGSQVMLDYSTGAGAIIWLPQCQWVNHEMSVPVPVKSSWQIWVKSMGAKPQFKSHDSPFPLQILLLEETSCLSSVYHAIMMHTAHKNTLQHRLALQLISTTAYVWLCHHHDLRSYWLLHNCSYAYRHSWIAVSYGMVWYALKVSFFFQISSQQYISYCMTCVQIMYHLKEMYIFHRCLLFIWCSCTV